MEPPWSSGFPVPMQRDRGLQRLLHQQLNVLAQTLHMSLLCITFWPEIFSEQHNACHSIPAPLCTQTEVCHFLLCVQAFPKFQKVLESPRIRMFYQKIIIFTFQNIMQIIQWLPIGISSIRVTLNKDGLETFRIWDQQDLQTILSSNGQMFIFNFATADVATDKQQCSVKRQLPCIAIQLFPNTASQTHTEGLLPFYYNTDLLYYDFILL